MINFKYKLSFDVPPSKFEISHKDQIILLGSCFSDNIGEDLKNKGFNVLSNPFGTLFHPSAIAKAIQNSIRPPKVISFYQREQDLFFSWDASGAIYGLTKKELEERIVEKRIKLLTALKNTSVLIITFGTAFGYILKETEEIVANCHKAPKGLFRKELTLLNTMIEEWKKLITELSCLNSNLKIIFTISPVRHEREGLIENNRSKARLNELTHSLKEEFTDIYYFPSYEIVVDELRDYRFYKADGLHPNNIAIEYVAESFSKTFFSEKTKNVIKEYQGIKSMLFHQSLYQGTASDERRQQKAEEKKRVFKKKYPEVRWVTDY